LYLIHFFVFLGSCFAADSTRAGKRIMQLIFIPFVAFLSGELIILLFYRVFATRAKGFVVILILMLFVGFGTSIANFIFISINRETFEVFPHQIICPVLTALA
ncbi:hypothetical protein PMAYCL1PPCAC_22762, partial [Pristionchus mayeri]